MTVTGDDQLEPLPNAQDDGSPETPRRPTSADSSSRCSPDPCRNTDRYRLVTPYAAPISRLGPRS